LQKKAVSHSTVAIAEVLHHNKKDIYYVAAISGGKFTKKQRYFLEKHGILEENIFHNQFLEADAINNHAERIIVRAIKARKGKVLRWAISRGLFQNSKICANCQPHVDSITIKLPKK